jgi:hypothetical protein
MRLSHNDPGSNTTTHSDTVRSNRPGTGEEAGLIGHKESQSRKGRIAEEILQMIASRYRSVVCSYVHRGEGDVEHLCCNGARVSPAKLDVRR